MIATIVWIAGFALLLVWLALAAARTRERAAHTLPRAAVILAAVSVAALGFGSAYVWGIDVARQGMDRILASVPEVAPSTTPDAAQDARAAQRAAEPPRARLFLRHVRLLLTPAQPAGTSREPAGTSREPAGTSREPAGTSPPGTSPPEYRAAIGYSPEAALRLPRSYGLAEARQGWDLLRASALGPQGLRIEAVEHPEPTGTRVLLHARRRAIAEAPSPDTIAGTADALVGRGGGRCAPAPDTAPARARPARARIDGPGAIYAIICAGRVPRAALVFERDLLAAADRAAETPVRVTPLVWRGSRWRPHHVQIASGSLIQIGTMADALPGVTLWEVPAPAGRAELFYPPANLLASCPEWLSGRENEGFFSHPALGPRPGPDRGRAPPRSGAGDSICVLPFTPPFGLEVRRLLPDLPGIGARSLWAAGLMTTPALLLLLLLCARPRSELSPRRFYRLLSLGWIAAFLAAVAVWRLLWAHRIDMLRDYESVGTRVLDNQVLLVLAGAALAATCVLAWERRPPGPPGREDGPRRRTLGSLAGAGLAWLLWLAVGGYALRGDLAGISPGPRLVGHALLSVLVGTAIGWLPLARLALARTAARLRLSPSLQSRASLIEWTRDPWAVSMAGMATLAGVALVAAAAAPRLVIFKLGAAWLLVLLVYAALRAAIASPGPLAPAPGTAASLWRVLAAFALGTLTAALLARLDPGVAVAVAGPGLIAALLFASHDARFADASLRQLGSYRRHHAPLVLAHAALLGLLGLGIALWSAGGLVAAAPGEPDAMLSRSLTLGAIHLLLFLAALFVPAAALAYLRRGARAAVPWLVVAALLAGAWALRGPVTDRVMASSTQAANRIAIVLDPAYALLHDETKFLSGITAWRETIVPPDVPGARAGGADQEPARHSLGQMLGGQGYFGAQLIDPGVLLSIENDYFPVLLLREAGILGVAGTALLLLVLVAGLWTVSGNRFRHGSGAQRSRALAAVVLGAVCVYQPLASLGALPLTGIAWPGLGLDSPSDFWILLALVLWVLVWGQPGQRAPGPVEAEPTAQAQLESFDSELRGSRLFRRVRVAAAATAAMAVVASLFVLGRASAFALRRPNPVDPQGRTVTPFESLERAVDYAFTLQCPWPQKTVPAGPEAPAAQAAAGLIPEDLLGDYEDDNIARFHAGLRQSWQAHRDRAVRELAEFLDRGTGCGESGRERAGPWTFERSAGPPDKCRMTFKVGWPEVELAVERDLETRRRPAGDDPGDAAAGPPADTPGDSAGAPLGPPAVVHTAACSVDVRAGVLRQLRFPARRPYRNARVRLVSRAMGAAARDLGELVSGHLVVRLRPGAGAVDVSGVSTGLYAAHEVRISDQLTVTVRDGKAVLQRAAAPGRSPGRPSDRPGGDRSDAWLFMRTPPGAAGPRHRVQVLEADEGTWRLLPSHVTEVPLSRLALLVVGGPDARSLWLFRPPAEWPGEDAAVHPLVADDIATVRGERRRHYLFGGLVPEIGWVNPYQARMSMGLDGWVRVAMSEYEQSPAPPRSRATWFEAGEKVPYCGPLEPPAAPPKGRDAMARVCHRSPLDGVLECRVSVQPELAIRLRHLLELVSLEPGRFSGDSDAVPPVRAHYALLRGDTGEIVAQGEFVPGRASSAYAPATPEAEQHLVRLREDRDPATGRKLAVRGQASAEKAEWSQPIAVGSTMKPMLARALELADPAFASSLLLDGAKIAGARCPGRRVHALLGHCPPTDSLWNRAGLTDMGRFLSHSVNWYQAAIGLLGTAVPGGSWGFGEDGPAADLVSIMTKNAGDYRPDAALWTRHRGELVVSANHAVHLDRLRATAMWRRFEQLLGRRLCTAGNKTLCRRHSARRDLCAARALPIHAPTRDLRHLVALGPRTFDFYPPLADPRRRVGPFVHTREYLQFLRGSGLHPLASLAQLADAFNRVIYQYDHDPAQTGYSLAASWFPVPATGSRPDWDCAGEVTGRDVRAGICEVVKSGTGRATLGPLLDDDRFIIYGAKTGTIDSLADIAEDRDACEHYASGHTLADRPAREDSQPYWLPCGRRRATADVNDSLVLVSVGVRTGHTVVPLTLGLRFQRSGPGFASRVAGHFLEAIHGYFAVHQTAP